jgi:beta-glucosidase
MAPDSWKGIYVTALAAVKSGDISDTRLDEGVARILRVKLQAGLFEKGKPSTQPLAGHAEIMGSNAHRDIAREAVRKSLVLLKNNGNVLPIANDAKILVVGPAANSMSQQTGGWTISWQGTDTTHTDFPKAQTILEGFEAAADNVQYSPDGTYDAKPDVAIVVYGETPYAEFKGDLKDVDFKAETENHLTQLRAFQAAGIPTVSIFLSGRPLWVNPELNASDGFVAAWLPGTEAGGIADVLFKKSASGKAYDFTGKLSFSWPKQSDQATLNVGDKDYDPLFAYGFGLNKSSNTTLAALDETLAGSGPDLSNYIFKAGRVIAPWSLDLRQGATENGNVVMANFDRFAQEDAVQFTWKRGGVVAFEGEAADMNHLFMPDAGFVMSLRVDAAPAGSVMLSAEGPNDMVGAVEIGDALRAAPIGEWTTISVPLKCLSAKTSKWASVTAPIVMVADAPLSFGLSGIVIKGLPEHDQICVQ